MSGATFVSDVAAAAVGQWPGLLAELGIEIPSRGKHGPCPACGGQDRFRLDDKGGRGTFICNQCGAGDGLDLVARVTGKSTKEAAKLVGDAIGLSHVVIHPDEREHLRQQQQARADAEQQRQLLQRQKAASRAAVILRDCSPGQAEYLVGKRLRWPSGLLNRTLIRVGEEAVPAGSLVVPLYNETGELVNVQLIRHDGVRHYLAGGQKQAACHRIPGSAMVAVCEGYATGLSVHLATGATVYCAMDAGNLLAIAQVVRGMDDPLQPCRLW
ncbi:MAG: primase-helicase zinc-binding domain-containing protein, partial [Aeromonas veronii]